MAQDASMYVLLLGNVSSATYRQPISDATVVLTDIATGTTDTTKSIRNGTFYFVLQNNKKYKVSISSTEIIHPVSQTINTANIESGTSIHTTLNPAFKKGKNQSPFPRPQEFHILGPEIDCECPPNNMPTFSPIPPPKVNKLPKSFQKVEIPTSNDDSEAIFIKKFTFKVQVGSFRKQMPTDSDFHKNLPKTTIIEPPHKGWFRYIAATFDNFESANLFKQLLRAKGFGDTHVFIYADDLRLENPFVK